MSHLAHTLHVHTQSRIFFFWRADGFDSIATDLSRSTRLARPFRDESQAALVRLVEQLDAREGAGAAASGTDVDADGTQSTSIYLVERGIGMGKGGRVGI